MGNIKSVAGLWISSPRGKVRKRRAIERSTISPKYLRPKRSKRTLEEVSK